jgi:hypothetical protein
MHKGQEGVNVKMYYEFHNDANDTMFNEYF